MQILTSRIRLLAVLAVLCAIATAKTAVAQVTYSSIANGDWNTSTTWSSSPSTPGGYPNSTNDGTDIVRLQGSHTVSISGASETADAADATVGYNGASGSISLSNGALALSSYIALGYQGGQTGTLIQSGGTLSAPTLYIGDSDSSSATMNSSTGSTGIYNYSGGMISVASKTYIGFSYNGDYGSAGTFSDSASGVGNSISMGLLYLNDDASGASNPSCNLAFTIGSAGVTPINCTSIYWSAGGGPNPNLNISLSSVPANGVIQLISTSTTSGGGAGTFGNLGSGGTVSATYGGNLYTWTVVTNGGSVSRDVDLTNETITASMPEPAAAAPVAFALLLFLSFRPHRQTAAAQQ